MERKPIPSFNDHQNCKGHSNSYLDCTYTKQEDVDLLDSILQYNIDKLEYEMKNENK